jgi:heptosyltransferase I
VQAHLSFARALGIDADEPVWNFPVTDEDRRFAEQMLPGDQRTLLISPCSSHVLRNWLSERYAKVADHAINVHGMRVVLSSGPAPLEKNLCRDIEAAMQGPVSNLAGQVSLGELTGLLERADIGMSVDSGPSHIANALGKPVIGLHACTWSSRGGPYNSLELCVDKFAEAARQFRNREPGEIRWGTKIEEPGVMALIGASAVVEKLDAAVRRLTG